VQDNEDVRSDSTARALRWIEQGSLTALFLALVIVGLAQIGFRNFAGIALPWADALMRSLVLWLTMVGAVVATGRLRHIRIDLVERWLSPRSVAWLRRVMFGATAVVCLIMTWTSMDMVELEYQFQAVAFLNVPNWIVMTIVPVGFAMMTARFTAWTLFPPSGAVPPVPAAGKDR
jgi:TRAP-type C4-dicarboxylate transport system permease small subunit